MNVLRKTTNGIILIFFGIMHTHLAISDGGFGRQFQTFSKSFFYKISKGMDELPATAGNTNFESAAAFWFFYFGLLIIPLGLLVHSIERQKKILPQSFTISYLILILIGAYMIPNSGMTIFMLPHAIYMLISNLIKHKRNKVSDFHQTKQ